MIAPLKANIASLLGTCSKLTTIYIKQYGPGNLRISGLKDELVQTIGALTQDGIAQATGDGWKQYFWEGDIYVITDADGPVVIIAPSNQFQLNRGLLKSSPALTLAQGSDLSTYS